MSQYIHPETIVDTQWLLEHLDDPNVCIIETDMSPELYEQATYLDRFFGTQW